MKELEECIRRIVREELRKALIGIGNPVAEPSKPRVRNVNTVGVQSSILNAVTGRALTTPQITEALWSPSVGPDKGTFAVSIRNAVWQLHNKGKLRRSEVPPFTYSTTEP